MASRLLLLLLAGLAVRGVVAVEARGDPLGLGRLGQQVARELFDGELVEALVGVERLDDVVAIREDPLVLVSVETHGVGEARDIEPPHRHTLAEMSRAQEPIDVLLIGVAKKIPPTRRQLFRRRRQTREIQLHATQQAVHRRLGR